MMWDIIPKIINYWLKINNLLNEKKRCYFFLPEKMAQSGQVNAAKKIYIPAFYWHKRWSIVFQFRKETPLQYYINAAIDNPMVAFGYINAGVDKTYAGF